MPFTSVAELPDDLRRLLPRHAQDIYKETFNSAFKQYDQPGERRGGDSREEVAHKVAWSAVKKAGYQKNSETGKWQKVED